RKNDEVILGNAGRLTEQKGQQYLIDMAEILKNEGIKFKLLIAGSGELKEHLLNKISEKDLTEEVQLLGHVEDMTAFFNSIDIFVFSSLYEGSANTLIEALEHKIPTVAFDISSNPEIIINGQTGILTAPKDPEAMAEAVVRLINTDQLKQSLALE